MKDIAQRILEDNDRHQRLVQVHRWYTRIYEYLQQFRKMCPRCGASLPIDAKGCSDCLLQFDKGRKKEC